MAHKKDTVMVLVMVSMMDFAKAQKMACPMAHRKDIEKEWKTAHQTDTVKERKMVCLTDTK